MRTIKFRAWDGTFDKKMFIVDRLSYTYDRTKVLATKMDYSSENAKFEQLKEKSGQFPIMQFTGLKDKNGKEIYEGDIYIFNRKTKNKYIVKSMQEFFEEKGYEEKEFGVPYNNIEVIGNIHEDKNLITKVMQVSECCGKFILEEDGTGNGRCSECKEWSLIIDEEE